MIRNARIFHLGKKQCSMYAFCSASSIFSRNIFKTQTQCPPFFVKKFNSRSENSYIFTLFEVWGCPEGLLEPSSKKVFQKPPKVSDSSISGLHFGCHFRVSKHSKNCFFSAVIFSHLSDLGVPRASKIEAS